MCGSGLASRYPCLQSVAYATIPLHMGDFARPLAMLPVLDGVAHELRRQLGLAGACRFELVCDVEGRVVEVWPHAEPGKLTRRELDLLVVPRE